MAGDEAYHSQAERRRELDPDPRPAGFDQVLKKAFAAGMRVSAVVTNEQVDHAFAEWRVGAFG